MNRESENVIESIDIFTWDDNFNTGIPKIDEQHKKLVKLINILASHIAFKSNSPELNLVFNELLDYATYHFQTEEEIWHRYLPDDDLESTHLVVHNSFLTNILKLKEEQSTHLSEKLTEEVLGFLIRWLALHILDEDRHMALVILALQSGMPLESAKTHAKEKMNGARSVYRDIIHSLFGNLSTNTSHLNRELAKHKLIEAELMQSRSEIAERENAFRTLVENTPDTIVRYDCNCRRIYVNPVLVSQIGKPFDEIVGTTPAESAQPEMLAYEEKIKEVLKNGQPDTFLLKWENINGEDIYVDLRLIPERDAEGNIVSVLGIGTDITRRVNVEQDLRSESEKNRVLLRNASDGIHILDAQGNIIEASDSFCALLGYERHEVIGMNVSNWDAKFNEAELNERAKIIYLEQKRSQFETSHLRKDGTIIEVEVSLFPLELNGKPVMFCSSRDITERKQAEIALLQQNQFSEDIIDSLPGIFYMVDLQGNFVRVNSQFMEVTGYSKSELDGMSSLGLFDEQDSFLLIHKAQEVFENGNAEAEIELITKSKQKIPYYFTGRRTTINNRLYVVGIGTDITEQKKAKERIIRLANFDQLTGLPNRTLLNDHFKYAINLAQRSGESLAVMFLDLDHFKDINDTLGHSIGDQVLMEVSSRLKLALREEDTLSRQGGDEFILILPGADADGAALVATKLIEIISQPFLVGTNELIVTPSIGIAIYPHDGETQELLSKNADAAMYRVKHEGRNNYHFYSPEMQAQSERNLKLANALRHALARNEFQVHYQPQLSLQDGHIVGVEALLRWQHPELGLISPAEFIPIAENNGQIIPIGEWVLRTATQQLKDWIDEGLSPMMMAVNLSAVQFRQNGLSKLITGILDDVKLPYHYLELELTEAATMDNPLAAIAVMDKLHEHGIRLSIDDFGTGYSSLSYLKQFNVYKLKIDQSFVRDISDDQDDKAIVTAIINMASSLGMQTIAEGVETASQLAFLRLQGCNEVQGYYFSKPLTKDEFDTFAKKHLSR
jgi:diguanylate cyclase (GGDEF)-like protein/hemerythrin-like metal-binding protein/PAS domain S-box-containing protein